MTAPARKATPANAAAVNSAKAKATTPPPPLDFSAVAVVKTAPPKRTSAVAPADNPAIAWVTESYGERVYSADSKGRPVWLGGGRSVTVPLANEVQVTNLIRSATRAVSRTAGEEVGVTVESVELTGKDKGKVTITFAAKTPKFTKRQAVVQDAKRRNAEAEAARAAAAAAATETTPAPTA